MRRWILAALVSLGAALPVAAQQGAGDGFSLIIASDPQFFRWRDSIDANCKTDVCTKSIQANRNVVAAMRTIGSLGKWPLRSGLSTRTVDAPVILPTGVIVNGDLTEYWHPAQSEQYKGIYGQLPYAFYPGLGNHDYKNNVNDCRFGTADKNRCAKEAVWYMANAIRNDMSNLASSDLSGQVSVYNGAGYSARFVVWYTYDGKTVSQWSPEFTAPGWRSVVVPSTATNISVGIEGLTEGWKRINGYPVFPQEAACFKLTGTIFDPASSYTPCPAALPDSSAGSLAYSWDMGNYHFVQLQYRPDYAVSLPESSSAPGFNVTPSLEWLRADLAATDTSKSIVINLHDAGVLSNQDFLNVLAGHRVVAIFSGHIHTSFGYIQKYDIGTRDVPLFRSGSAECEVFLLVEFHRDHFNVGTIQASGGQPSFAPQGATCDSFPNNAQLFGTFSAR